jgi:hypothetical protein
MRRRSISAATAKAHVARLLTKLCARDRVQLVMAAYEAGLAVPAEQAVSAQQWLSHKEMTRA